MTQAAACVFPRFKGSPANRGLPGIDGMTVDGLNGYLIKHYRELSGSIRGGRYQPKPVKRVEIPKPEGGKRLLGIPTVIDRMVQQATVQVLQPVFERTFSDSSFGFRPGRILRGNLNSK
jgi:retron-type reverse transcriptase